MAKKITRTTTEEVDAEGVEDAPEPLDEDVIRALVELDGSDEITWTVTRVSEPNSGFCGEMSTVELSKRRIAEAYGPGRYRVQGTKPDGKYFKSGRISIATPATIASSNDKTADLLESLKGKMSGGDSMLPLLLAMIQTNGQIVSSALARPPEPKRDFPWSALLAAAPLTLTAVKDFFKNDTDSNAMEKLLKQLTILEKLRGTDKESGGTSWPDIIRDGLSALRGMAPVASPARVAQPVSAHAVGGTSVALPMADPAVHTPEAIEPTAENLTMDWLRRKLDELLQNASQNKNAELRAEVFIDDLPPFVPEAMIKEMLSREDWFEQLCAFDQRALNYHGWLNEFRDCVLDLLKGEVTNDRKETGSE